MRGKLQVKMGKMQGKMQVKMGKMQGKGMVQVKMVRQTPQHINTDICIYTHINRKHKCRKQINSSNR